MGVLMGEQLNRGTKDGCVYGWATKTEERKMGELMGEQLNTGTKDGCVNGWAIKQRNKRWMC